MFRLSFVSRLSLRYPSEIQISLEIYSDIDIDNAMNIKVTVVRQTMNETLYTHYASPMKSIFLDIILHSWNVS